MKKLAKLNPDQFPARVRDLKQLEDSIISDERQAGAGEETVEEMMDEIVMEEEAEMEEEVCILCLILRTTVTSLSAFKDIRYKTHPLCINPGIPF